MGDRAHAHITIGGPVRRKHWRDVEDALTREFGPEFSRYVLRYEEELKKSRRVPPAASAGIPLKKLDRLVGIALEFEVEEVSGGRFDDLQSVLREAGLHYLVHSDGHTGSWPIADTWWFPDDAHRGAEGWGPFYNTFGERYLEYIDGDRNVRPAMDEEQIRAAFTIARDELSKADLPPGPDYGDELLRRVIEIGTKLPAIPPISILEE